MKKHLYDIQEPSDLSGMEAFGTETRSRVSDLFRRTRMPVVAVAVLTPPSVLGAKIRCRDYIERPKPEIAKLVAQRPVVQVCGCIEY